MELAEYVIDRNKIKPPPAITLPGLINRLPDLCL